MQGTGPVGRVAILVAGLLVVATVAAADCPPLPAGTELFPSTMNLVMTDSAFGEPFVVRLSGANHPHAEIEHGAQAGETVPAELTVLELSGYQPRVGAVSLRASPTQPSLGQIGEVELGPSCELAGGKAWFDLFVELDLPGLGETWISQEAIRVEGDWDRLPPLDARLESPTVSPIVLVDRETAAEQGELFYALLHAAPPFPPAGFDCADALLTGELYLASPDATVDLLGFGPSRVRRGPTVPGGLCRVGGTPCEDDDDCLFLDTCARDRVETELLTFDLTGFDALLGSWQLAVRPGTGTSDCCEAHAEPGCSDPVCESWVCGQDSYCCDLGWDFFCASLAASEPLCADDCFDPEAAPSEGSVRSLHLDRTYPAASELDLFVRIDSDLQGSLRNGDAIPLAAPTPLTNLPPDPDTEHQSAGPGVAVLDESDLEAGALSNLVITVQAPRDCELPPAADEACFEARLELGLTLPPCPPETLRLDGPVRLLRDDPVDEIGLGQEVIATLVARAELAGVSACHGPVTVLLRSSAASGGEHASLAPEEFFPADSFFDLALRIETAADPVTAESLRLTTSINALPPDPGELYFGPDSAVLLRDGSEVEVGAIEEVTLELLVPAACPAGGGTHFRAAGPTHADFEVVILEGGGGVAFDVVRGDLSALAAGQGSFASAVCLVTDAGPAVSDPAQPAQGDGFYYVARDGFGAFNGSWNGPGSRQEGDRDLRLPSCP